MEFTNADALSISYRAYNLTHVGQSGLSRSLQSSFIRKQSKISGPRGWIACKSAKPPTFYSGRWTSHAICILGKYTYFEEYVIVYIVFKKENVIVY